MLNQQAGQISKHHQDFVKQKGNIRQNEVLNQQAEHNQTHAVFFYSTSHFKLDGSPSEGPVG